MLPAKTLAQMLSREDVPVPGGDILVKMDVELAEWGSFKHADVDTLAAMSHRGRDAFDRFLSFGTRKREDKDDKDALPMRMASALLEEVAIVSRPKSQLEIVLALAD